MFIWRKSVFASVLAFAVILAFPARSIPQTASAYTLLVSALNPSSIQAPTPVTATATITVGGVNGYSGTIRLSCNVIAAQATGPTCAVSPSTITLPMAGSAYGSATLTVTTTSQTTAGTRPVTVTGIDGTGRAPSNVVQSVSFNVLPIPHTVLPIISIGRIPITNLTPIVPSYTLSVAALAPPSIVAGTAAAATATVTVTRSATYSGTISLSCNVIAAQVTGPTCAVSPPTVTLSTTGGLTGTATLTVTTTGQTTVGTRPVSVSATDGTGLAPSNGQQSLSFNVTPNPLAPLNGFVDLHTHPASFLGFGGKLVYGPEDVGAPFFMGTASIGFPYVAQKVSCFYGTENSEAQALGPDELVHGGFSLNGGTPLAIPPVPPSIDNPCGDIVRQAVIQAMQSDDGGYNNPPCTGSGQPPICNHVGFPNFTDWPQFNDITHQRMWVDWIRRTHFFGLNVMVALAVNTKLLGDMTAGPGDWPTDDMSNADRQIDEIKRFVGNHFDFMEIALSSADVHRIVSLNKMAVVIGVEIDTPGNLTTLPGSAVTSAQLIAEIDRLYNDKGVRYIFPVHLVDNPIGGSAAYKDLFNDANVYESGHGYALGCASDAESNPSSDPSDLIDYVYAGTDNVSQLWKNVQNFDFSAIGGQAATTSAEAYKLGSVIVSPPSINCAGRGNVNTQGLTPSGELAIQHMMSLGMLIDIDHMSEASANRALTIAEGFGYPVNSGHNGLRQNATAGHHSERSFTPTQYGRIGALHGMAGVGSAGDNAQDWLTSYNQVISAMGFGAVAGFGTDTDGLEIGMPPRLFAPGWPTVKYNNAFPISTDQNSGRTWDYNALGVAHYGMIPDFIQDILTLPGGPAMVNGNLMQGADYFYKTWQLAESRATAISQGFAPCSPYVNAFADVTGDGKADAIVVNSLGVVVRPSSGSTFLPNQNWTQSPYYGVLGTYFADVTGDGKADAIVVNPGGITVRRSDGNQFLPNETWTADPYYGSLGTYFADVTGDGMADAIVVNPGGITVRRSNGTQFLANETWATNPFYGVFGTYFADVTGDGKADAIVVNPVGITVRRSDGTQFLANETWLNQTITGKAYFADVDGDGKADLILVASDGVHVYLSNGSGFVPGQWATGPYYGSIGTYFADVTGDHKADAIVSNPGAITVRSSDGSQFLTNQDWTTGPYYTTSYSACLTSTPSATIMAFVDN